ncbi:hypothetical protein [Sphingomonas sp. 8AM]|uniref:hypothetical protein n=1 Tax=Sphingomonas sp. 8AM TaxID=2653170 RepID=UPI0012F39E33|nr:hypothetical protein [Sphingomonas sp. 8AM]VXD02886.1 conserved hypothetical protein [Sphingomonas sp. 8AM]
MIMVTPKAALRLCSGSVLAEKALKNLKAALTSFGSNLSPPAEMALSAVLTSMEAGLKGELPPSFYLSAVDPGNGKSLAVAMFLRAYKASGFLPANGVLVLVSRLAEIEAYLVSAGLDRNEVAVLTSDPATNALGAPEALHDQAPIMFTTQQRLAARGAKSTMNALPAFFYQGAPRALRVWDESILPGEEKTVKVDDLGALLGPLRASRKAMAASVQSTMVKAWSAPPSDVLTIPEDLGGGWGKASAHVGSAELAALAGHEARVISFGGDVRLAGAAPTLPADFAPAVVLDASGRVRETYRLWESRTASLTRLPSAVNDYSDMTVHVWRHAAGKRTLADAKARRPIVEAIVEAICNQPAEEWLIVHYKDVGTLVPEVRLKLDPEVADRVHGLTWGRHHGTNAFAHVPNIVLVGYPDYGEHGYEAVAAAAIGDGKVPELTEEERVALREGEVAHNILQAVCRSHARAAQDGVAGACQVYLCMSPSLNLRAVLDRCFPGHQRRAWAPGASAELGGRKGQLVRYLTDLFEASPEAVVRKGEVTEALSLQRPALSRLLLDGAVKEALDALWIEESRLSFQLRRPSFRPYPGGGFNVRDLLR